LLLLFVVVVVIVLVIVVFTVVKYNFTCKVMEYQRVILDNRSNRRNLVDKLQSADTDRKQQWEQVSSCIHTYMLANNLIYSSTSAGGSWSRATVGSRTSAPVAASA
jgi:hypothetical protein